MKKVYINLLQRHWLFTFRDVGSQVREAPFDAGVDVGVSPVAWQDVWG
jgi:hypothetical protein